MNKRCMGCMELYNEEYDICPHCGYIKGTPAEEAIHMEPGTLLHDRYIVGKVLGFGGFGVTYIGWDGRLEQKVAIKEYLPGEFSTRMPGQSTVTVFNGDKEEQFRDGMEKFVDEAKRLARFQNETGIVKIFDSFYENETAYIIMEYLDGETLTERLSREKTIPEDEAIDMIMPVMNSLQVVHNEGILHRDIAPDNIFLTKDGEVKLIDFGASRFATTSHSRSLTVIIKPGYSPEEQYRSRGDQGPYTDVYAVAATLYKMITGKTPPDAMERRASVESKRRDILVPPHNLTKNISKNRENAILNAMNVQIEDRTQDIQSFIYELNADPPVKRRYGKIKKIDLYTWPLWLKILIPSVLAVVLVFGILLGAGVIKFSSLFSGDVVVPEGSVIVPEVEGMGKDDAVASIKNAKLNASAQGNVVSDYVQAGKIVLQTPNGGSYLEEYGVVILTVSSGKEVEEAKNGKSTVPYVIWDTQEDAINKLKKAGLAEPVIETKSDETVEAGRVISQSVEFGKEVDEGTQITLVISTGPEAFEMPDLTGKTITEARDFLGTRGVKVNTSFEKSDSVEKNNVIKQSVSAGTKIKKGDSVTLIVSSGTEAQSSGSNTSNNSKQSNNSNNQSPNAQAKSITVNLNPNGGSVSSNSITVAVESGATYGNLPTPKRDYYRFTGWYTQSNGGSSVSSVSSLVSESNHTLYAHWEQKAASGWVRASGVPSGAKIVDTKWEYSLKETTSSGNSSLSGWIRDDSKTTSNWVQTGSGVYRYASFPSGYNTNDSFYRSYGKSRAYSSTNGNKKTEYGNPYNDGNIYWHWACEKGRDSGNWFIGGYYNETLYYNNGAYWGQATQWCSFKTNDKPSKYSSYETGHCAAWSGKCYYSMWFFELPVYAQNYTNYEKKFTYSFYRITNNLSSNTDPSGQSAVSNVVKYVRYIEK